MPDISPYQPQVIYDEFGQAHDATSGAKIEPYSAPAPSLGQSLKNIAWSPVEMALAPFRAAGRLFGTPSNPGTWPQGPDYGTNAQDMRDVLSGVYLHNAVNPAAAIPDGALGMFAGRNAKTADQAALARAEEMHAAGAPHDQIWNETGWFKGPDDKWRFEIPDDATSFNKDSMTPKSYRIFDDHVTALTGDAKGVLPHSSLYEAYPQLGEIPTVQGRSSGDFKGQYSGDFNGSISPSISLDFDQLGTPNDMRSTMLHELSHGLQNIEGFANGSNSSYAPKNVPNPALKRYHEALQSDPRLQEYNDIHASPLYATELADQNARWKEVYEPELNALDEMVFKVGRERYNSELKPKIDDVFARSTADFSQRYPTMARSDALAKDLMASGIPTREPRPFLDPYEVYRRSAGEVEARNVQKRMDMTPEQRRATPPWQTQDVPYEDQIIQTKADGGIVYDEYGQPHSSDTGAKLEPQDLPAPSLKQSLSNIAWSPWEMAKGAVLAPYHAAKQLFGTPSSPGHLWEGPSTPGFDSNPNAQAMTDLIMSGFGGNAFNPVRAAEAAAVEAPLSEGVSVRGYRGADNPTHIIPDPSKQLRRSSGGFWGTSSPEVANTYAGLDPDGLHWWNEATPAAQKELGDLSDNPVQIRPTVAPADFNFKNPMIVDAQGSPWGGIPYGDKGGVTSSDVLARYARMKGHDGLILQNILDHVGDVEMSPADTYAALQRGTVTSPLTGETLFSDTGKTNPVGAALAGQLPMDEASRLARAREMGFDTENTAYRGLTRPFDESDTGHYQMFTSNPHEASEYAMKNPLARPNVVPAYLRMQNPLEVDAGGSNFNKIFTGRIPWDVRKNGLDSVATMDELAHAAKLSGFDGLRVRNVYDNVTGERPSYQTPAKNQKNGMSDDELLAELGIDPSNIPKSTQPPTVEGYRELEMGERRPTTISTVFDPANIRSKFAAFNPTDKDKAGLLLSDTGKGSPVGAAIAGQLDSPGFDVWHGSPHDFDKFDLSKIGTGEGAQAYGSGLYFAENPGVAKGYQSELSQPSIGGKPFDENDWQHLGAQYLHFSDNDAARAAQRLKDDSNRYRSSEPAYSTKLLRAAGALERGDNLPSYDPGGYLYQARINANPEDFLDWDRPLSEQSEAAKAALANLDHGQNLASDAHTPYDVLNGLTRGKFNNPANSRKALEATKALREAGIPGIKYLDAGSRGAGDGSRNYVLFDDSLVNTVHKWRGDQQLYSDTGDVNPVGAAMAGAADNSLSGNEGLSYLLNPPTKNASILGSESGKVPKDGLGVLKSANAPDGFESNRLVVSKGGKIVGAMQVTKTPNSKYTVANTYVDPSFRRQGIATQLNDYATKLYGDLDRSPDASEQGAAFRQSLGAGAETPQDMMTRLYGEGSAYTPEGPHKGRLIHGTLADNIPDIRNNWLEPQAGHFVESAYGDEYGNNLPSLVYMAEPSEAQKAANAVRSHIANKLSKSFHDVTHDDIRQHGAFITARPNPRDTWRMNDDQTSTNLEGDKGYHYDEAQTAEPGDYYSFDAVPPTGFLTGNRLLDFWKKHGLYKGGGRV